MTRKVQNGPSETIAHHFSAFAAAKSSAPGEHDDEAAGRSAQRALDEHQQERAGIGDAHEPVDVAGGLDAAPRALAALVGRGAPGLDQHGAEHDDETG